MRHTRAHTRNRRSHHALVAPALSKCPDCGVMRLSHRVCEACGKYRGVVVIDMVKAAEKKVAKAKVKAHAGHEHGKKDAEPAEAK